MVFQPNSGYTIQPDGKLYKVYPHANMDAVDATRFCWEDAATVAVPYPESVYNFMIAMLPANDLRWPTGAIRWSETDFTSGQWVTFDGNTIFPPPYVDEFIKANSYCWQNIYFITL